MFLVGVEISCCSYRYGFGNYEDMCGDDTLSFKNKLLQRGQLLPVSKEHASQAQQQPADIHQPIAGSNIPMVTSTAPMEASRVTTAFESDRVPTIDPDGPVVGDMEAEPFTPPVEEPTGQDAAPSSVSAKRGPGKLAFEPTDAWAPSRVLDAHVKIVVDAVLKFMRRKRKSHGGDKKKREGALPRTVWNLQFLRVSYALL